MCDFRRDPLSPPGDRTTLPTGVLGVGDKHGSHVRLPGQQPAWLTVKLLVPHPGVRGGANFFSTVRRSLTKRALHTTTLTPPPPPPPPSSNHERYTRPPDLIQQQEAGEITPFSCRQTPTQASQAWDPGHLRLRGRPTTASRVSRRCSSRRGGSRRPTTSTTATRKCSRPTMTPSAPTLKIAARHRRRGHHRGVRRIPRPRLGIPPPPMRRPPSLSAST